MQILLLSQIIKTLQSYERLIEAKDQLISRSHYENQNIIESINPKSLKEVAMRKLSKTKVRFNFQKGFCNNKKILLQPSNGNFQILQEIWLL